MDFLKLDSVTNCLIYKIINSILGYNIGNEIGKISGTSYDSQSVTNVT